jgi:hypothetical protein
MLSVAMTIVSALAYGVIGKKSAFAMRGISVLVVLLFVLSQILFIVFEKPHLVQDITRYWTGAIASTCFIVLQGRCNRKNFRVLIRGSGP